MNNVVETVGSIVQKVGNASTLPPNLKGLAGLRCLCDEPLDLLLVTDDVNVIENGQGSLI